MSSYKLANNLIQNPKPSPIKKISKATLQTIKKIPQKIIETITYDSDKDVLDLGLDKLKISKRVPPEIKIVNYNIGNQGITKSHDFLRMPTLKDIATDSISKGIPVKDALKGAKEIIAATGEPTRKSAAQSACIFATGDKIKFGKYKDKEIAITNHVDPRHTETVANQYMHNFEMQCIKPVDFKYKSELEYLDKLMNLDKKNDCYFS